MRLFAALLVGAAAAGCTAPDAGAPAAGPPAPVTGVRVALEHEERPAPGPAGVGKVAWTSSWRLSWDPVPGATAYAVRYATSEGAGNQAPRVLTGADTLARPSLLVEAAAGTSSRARLDQDRDAGLLFTSSQLLVSVAARSAGGESPASLLFPVGDVPPDGVPRGSERTGGHGGGEERRAGEHSD